MDKYLLSIIIPHYNIPQLLSKLIDSIPKKSDIQIIVVDDNSTEDIEELKDVIENNIDRNIEFYKNYTGKNSPGTCRNIGIEHAKGKWILFADADDFYVDGWYEKLKTVFDSDNEIVYYKPTSINVDTGVLDTRHILMAKAVEKFCNEPNRKNELGMKYYSTSACTMLCNRSFLNEKSLRFGNTMRGEDTMFTVMCGQAVKKFACLNEEIYCITKRAGSITTKTDMRLFDEHMRVKIWKFGFLYKNLNDSEIPLLELEYAGLKIWREAKSVGCDRNTMKSYREQMKKAGVPMISWRHFNLFTLIKQATKSILVNLKERVS